MDQFLERDIQYLKGVGDKRARLFHKLGIFVVGDLVRYYPRTYEDWSVTTPAAQAPEGTTVCVQATMVTPMRTHLIRKGMTLYKADFTDGETLIHVTLFNTKFLAEKLRMYQDYLLLGKVERNFTTVQMNAPKIEPLTARRIHPIYTQTGSLNANLIAKAVDYALAHMAPLPDTLSPALREKYGLEDLDTAVRNIHFPSNAKALEAARHRLIFEELLTLTVGLKKLKGRKRTPTTRVIEKDCTAAFAARLPFTLTGAQSRAVAQCIADLQSGYPMNRLLQGDVGSGKTAVAAALLDTMVQNGYQCALMAPTEILATQHYATLQKFFAGTNTRLCLLTGACTAKEKRQIKADLLEGNIHIAVGTHALIQNDVEFANLGLVVIDEASMVSLEMLAGILNRVRRNCRVVLLGDPNQLQAVGAGNVLPDLLELGVPSIRLAQQYRQSAEAVALRQNVVNFPKLNTEHELRWDDSFRLLPADDRAIPNGGCAALPGGREHSGPLAGEGKNRLFGAGAQHAFAERS